MATTRGIVQSGNRIQVEFDGKKIGFVQSLRMSDSYGLEAAGGIGDIHVIEHVPTTAMHSIAVSKMVLRTELMRSAGLAPENGDDALLGVVFDIVTYSKDTGQPLRIYEACSYDSGDVDVSAHRIVVSNAQYKALNVRDTGF
jgi:hypothetical protein